MRKYLLLVLSVSLSWGQVEEGISYYDSGLKKHQRPYENKVANGKWIYWYDNGQKEYEKHYKKGKLSGPYTSWWENGNKWSEGSYINGNLIGM